MQEVPEALGLIHGVELEVDDDVLGVVDRPTDLMTPDAGLLSGAFETLESLLPHTSKSEMACWMRKVGIRSPSGWHWTVSTLGSARSVQPSQDHGVFSTVFVRSLKL